MKFRRKFSNGFCSSLYLRWQRGDLEKLRSATATQPPPPVSPLEAAPPTPPTATAMAAARKVHRCTNRGNGDGEEAGYMIQRTM